MQLSNKFLKIIIFLLFLTIGGYFYQISISKHPADKPFVVAITQIAPHPSLDKICDGIKEYLEENFGNQIEIIVQNANGNVTMAAQIAQKFASQKPKINIIVPITTTSAQAVYSAALQNNIPVIFAAVTDPISAKLADSKIKGKKGISGLSDYPDTKAQVSLIQQFFKTLKGLKVGILYNAGEVNSLSHTECLTTVLQEAGAQVITKTVINTTEITSALLAIVEKIDLLMLPNCNTVISGIDSILPIANKYRKPVFASDPESVEHGCVAAVAPDQKQMGVQVGKMVKKVLTGEKIDNIPIEYPLKNLSIINDKVAKDLKLARYQK